ncbi:MAG TPA: hypothetical protein VGC63_12455 [Solirubrobacterales bacterium]|jgi:hypothetical protein
MSGTLAREAARETTLPAARVPATAALPASAALAAASIGAATSFDAFRAPFFTVDAADLALAEALGSRFLPRGFFAA